MLVIITGPTSSGKTAVAEDLVGYIDGEIISADSRTRYRSLKIGNGRSTMSDHVPYHIVDDLDLDESSSSHDWVSKARRAVDDIISRGRTPIICGGTIHFIQRFMDGLEPGPQPDPKLRKELRKVAARDGPASLHSILKELDPEASTLVHPRNTNRTIRYIEKALIEDMVEEIPPYRGSTRSFFLLRERSYLNDRIRSRTNQMIQEGWVDEVQRNIKMAYPRDSPGFKSIGYRHIISLLDGVIGPVKAEELINRDTIDLSRRQQRWSRKLGINPIMFMKDTQIGSISKRIARSVHPQE